MSERNTFSPFWHRVRAMRPRLRPHVQITRQRFWGGRWYVVHDPSANGFYRVSAVQHEFVALLDGKRSVEEVWKLNLSRHGDDALTQNDVIQVLSQLYQGNLLQAELSPEAEQLLQRGRERRKKKAIQQAIGLMYFKVPLFNPNRIFGAIEPVLRPMLSRFGLVVWAGLIIAAIAALVPHWKELQGGFASAIAPANWIWMALVWVVLKLWHETGHGVMTKRFGGQVPVFGAMMLVLIPSPFVDASAAWSFKNKWHRVLVGAGGMMFELFVAAIAAFVWLATRDSPGLLHQLAYNVMLTASVSTIIFNANPLMRFDGYFILSDLLGVPNLMQRSMNLLKFLFQKHVYRVENPQAPTSDAGEALVLLIYGILALAYRVLIFISITLYVMGIMFGLGLILAIWTAAMWFIMPLGQLVHWLATHGQLTHIRARAVLTTLAMFAAGLLLLGAVPVNEHRRASGVVESSRTAGLFAVSDGFLEVMHARAGQPVQAGEALITLRNDELASQLRLAHAQLRELTLREQQEVSRNPATAQIVREYARSVREQIALLDDRIERLTLRAPHTGVFILPQDMESVGAWIQAGTPLGEVIDPGDLRVAAVLSQEQADWIGSMEPSKYRIQARRASRVHEVIDLALDRLPPAARRDLPHAALTFAGGGTIPTRKDERGGETMQSAGNVLPAYFVARATEGATSARVGMPGERITLRFTLPRRPLLSQWIDRVEETLQGRVKI